MSGKRVPEEEGCVAPGLVLNPEYKRQEVGIRGASCITFSYHQTLASLRLSKSLGILHFHAVSKINLHTAAIASAVAGGAQAGLCTTGLELLTAITTSKHPSRRLQRLCRCSLCFLCQLFLSFLLVNLLPYTLLDRWGWLGPGTPLELLLQENL